MFLGEYAHAIDNKGRVTIPAKYRGLVAAGVVVTRGFDQNLICFPMTEWESLAKRIAAKPLSDQSMRAFRRRLFSGAVDLVPDRQGRILLPPYLREFAGIDDEVIIAGMNDYIELWSSDAWAAEKAAIESSDVSWADLGI
jgi:MraZ protein